MSPYHRIIQNFIVFEGIDGSGTTTQVALLVKRFETAGMRVHRTAEPTDSGIGKLIRRALQRDPSLHPRTLALLFAADRCEHLYADTDGILPVCASGTPVVCDRYLFSSLAYQSVEGEFADILGMNRGYPLPEHVFFLNLPPEQSEHRISGRDTREIYENASFQAAVFKNYRRAFEAFADSGMKLHTLDATEDPNRISRRVWSVLSNQPI
jgi:dTMP kinase